MNQENRIIAIRKRDFHEAHKAFVELMGRTEEILNDEAKKSPNDFPALWGNDKKPGSVLLFFPTTDICLHMLLSLLLLHILYSYIHPHPFTLLDKHVHLLRVKSV